MGASAHRPLIYFSYGITKSGSTLAYQLARTALETAGLEQPILSNDAVIPRRKINFVAHIDAARAKAIRTETRKVGHPVAIKTHTRPDPEVVKMLNLGEAFAHAIYRDPREIALSMLDHGKTSRERDRTPFAEYNALEDTIDNIRHQTNTLLAWLSLPNVRPLYYDDIAFDMLHTTELIAEELGVRTTAREIVDNVSRGTFTQKNKAKRARFEEEMDAETSSAFKRIFAPLYDRLINDRSTLPRDGRPILDPTVSLCDWDATFPPALTGETR